MGMSSSHLQQSTSPGSCLVPLVVSVGIREKERETSSEGKNVVCMLRNSLGNNCPNSVRSSVRQVTEITKDLIPQTKKVK